MKILTATCGRNDLLIRHFDFISIHESSAFVSMLVNLQLEMCPAVFAANFTIEFLLFLVMHDPLVSLQIELGFEGVEAVATRKRRAMNEQMFHEKFPLQKHFWALPAAERIFGCRMIEAVVSDEAFVGDEHDGAHGTDVIFDVVVEGDWTANF